jgi:hypothetical protein
LEGELRGGDKNTPQHRHHFYKIGVWRERSPQAASAKKADAFCRAVDLLSGHGAANVKGGCKLLLRAVSAL